MPPSSTRNLPFPGTVLNNLQTWMTRDRESEVSSVCCYQPPFVLLYNEDTTVPDKVGGVRLEKSSKNMAVLCNRNSAFHLQEKVSERPGSQMQLFLHCLSSGGQMLPGDSSLHVHVYNSFDHSPFLFVKGQASLQCTEPQTLCTPDRPNS